MSILRVLHDQAGTERNARKSNHTQHCITILWSAIRAATICVNTCQTWSLILYSCMNRGNSTTLNDANILLARFDAFHLVVLTQAYIIKYLAEICL